MYIKVQISDELYKALVAGGKRKRGSIALVSPKEGNFNVFASSMQKPEERKFIKLPHGRASVGSKEVRLHLCIDRKECDVMPASVIVSESAKASVFVDQVMPE